MPVSFNSIPANWRMPLYWVEVDPSQAGFPTLRQPALLVGQMFTSGGSAGTASPNVPVAISSVAQARTAFGIGSMLERMFTAFFANNAAHEVWGVGVAEPGAGVAATGTITVATAPTNAGTLSIYIAGQRIEVAVGAADTVTTVAAAIAAAVTATPTLPVTAASALGVVTLTCKWKGTTGNDIDLRDNYAGALGGEELPTSLTLTYSGAKLTGGTGAPTFTTAIANLGEANYEYVALPFSDSTTLGLFKTEYGFGDTGRWGWMRQLYGHVFSGIRDSYANLLTFGPTHNSGVVSIMAFETNMPTPVWEAVSAYTAKSARALLNDPARPLQTLSLDGVLPAPRHQRFSLTELNNIAGVGLATQGTDDAGLMRIRRESTTYQTNVYGQGDDAYELVTTLATLARLFRNQRQRITSKYPRHKLANDGTRFGPGQAIVTPKTVKAELVAQYREDEFNGLVEDGDNFKRNLIVERDVTNPNRLNVLYPPDLVNQLRIFAVLAQFRLQYNRGVDPAQA